MANFSVLLAMPLRVFGLEQADIVNSTMHLEIKGKPTLIVGGGLRGGGDR